MLVKTASKFRSEFKIQKDEMLINGKSIMGVMMLAAECGAELELILDGIDEEEAMATIEELINSKFNEE
jgi:phosphocarrier protein